MNGPGGGRFRRARIRLGVAGRRRTPTMRGAWSGSRTARIRSDLRRTALLFLLTAVLTGTLAGIFAAPAAHAARSTGDFSMGGSAGARLKTLSVREMPPTRSNAAPARIVAAGTAGENRAAGPDGAAPSAPASAMARVRCSGPIVQGEHGAFYVIDAEAGELVRIAPDGDCLRRKLPVAEPGALAVDRKGNVYVTAPAESAVYHLPVDGPPRRIAEGLPGPTGLAADRDGNLFVTCADGTVRRIPAPRR